MLASTVSPKVGRGVSADRGRRCFCLVKASRGPWPRPRIKEASYLVGPNAGAVDALTWRAGAHQKQGSWWTEWAAWTIERAGDAVPAPKSLGNADHPALTPAPGLYVRDEVTA